MVASLAGGAQSQTQGQGRRGQQQVGERRRRLDGGHALVLSGGGRRLEGGRVNRGVELDGADLAFRLALGRAPGDGERQLDRIHCAVVGEVHLERQRTEEGGRAGVVAQQQ